MSRKKRFLLGLLFLLLAPTLVLALFALYAYIDNSRPQSGDLQTWVKPAVVFPGGETSYFMKFNGKKSTAQPSPPPPLDVTFIVDVSSSMTESLPAMADAATAVLKEFTITRPAQVQFALIRFDTAAVINTDWSANIEDLSPGLRDRDYVSTGGTNPREAFDLLDELLQRARPQAKKVVVWYTDGGFAGMTEDEILARCKSLRDSGVDMYAVSVPGEGAAGIMYQMVDDPRHVFNPTNAKDLATNFRFLTEGIMQAIGEGGQLSHWLDGRHFAVPLEDTGWTADRTGLLSLTIGRLPEIPSTYGHPLIPLSAGLWSVGVDPPKIFFADENEQLQTIQATHRPVVLVITWFTLFLMMLPALLWTLLHIPKREPRQIEEKLPLPPVTRPHLPSKLPALPNLMLEQSHPVPALFIGLGGAGRRALGAVRADLKQAHLGHQGQPYRFLWIDTDTKEVTRDLPSEDWNGYPIEELMMPTEVRQIATYLPEMGKTPEYLRWFDARPYQNVSRNELNLAEGTRGDRTLARLAWFEWLAKNPNLLMTLVNKCDELLNFASADGTRQIVVFASADGGVGSGWFLDTGRLLHRIVRQRQAEGTVFVPEIIGVLSQPRESHHPENWQALEMEIQSAGMSGAFPQQVIYVPNEALLEKQDTESPYDWIFKCAGNDADTVASQNGELAATLVERFPRASLLDQTNFLDWQQPIQVSTQGLHVLPTLIYEQVHYELFLRLLGPDILLDIQPTVRGGFAPQTIPEAAVIAHLENLVKEEVPGTLWQLLLAAASNPVLTPAFYKVLQEMGNPSKEWIINSFSLSLTRSLQGHADLEQAGWQRSLMPCQAIALLRLLANRLEREVKIAIKAQGEHIQAIHTLDLVITIARVTADELEQWVQDFCAICERVSIQRSELSKLEQHSARLNNRKLINPEITNEQVEQWARACLESWLGTPDTISAIRERLFFAVLPKGQSTKTMVRSCIEGVQDFNSAEELAMALDRYARTLAYLVPAVSIGGALGEQSEVEQKMLARTLVDTGSKPRQVLVVAPKAANWRTVEAHILDEFRKSVPQPAYHGIRLDREGNDHSAIRRLELVEAGDARHLIKGKLPFIEAAEQIAEALRQRAEKKFNLNVPPFPPQLRIAVAQVEAFQSFARAYQSGHVVRLRDAVGAEQWALLDTVEFLTFGSDDNLSAAAANYVWYIGSAFQSFQFIGEGGSFTKLKNWLDDGKYPDDDTLAQIAIDVYES